MTFCLALFTRRVPVTCYLLITIKFDETKIRALFASSPQFNPFPPPFLPIFPTLEMPRKAAAAATDTRAEPRRSSRIKEQPKPDPPKKAPSKPRAKKAAAKVAPAAEDEPEEGETAAPKPKSSRGKKRTTEEVNGPGEEAEKPPSKKVGCNPDPWIRC